MPSDNTMQACDREMLAIACWAAPHFVVPAVNRMRCNLEIASMIVPVLTMRAANVMIRGCQNDSSPRRVNFQCRTNDTAQAKGMMITQTAQTTDPMGMGGWHVFTKMIACCAAFVVAGSRASEAMSFVMISSTNGYSAS